MEIYTNSTERRVYLDVPVEVIGSTMDITVWDGEEMVYTASTVTYEDGRYYTVLPFSLCQSEHNYEVEWIFPYTDDGDNYEYNDRTFVEVVTPVLTPAEIREVLNDPGASYVATDEEVLSIERAVRHIIKAHTGQTFGKFVGTKSVTGSGDPYLYLPARLLSGVSVNGNTNWNAALAVRGNGWFLRSKTLAYAPPIRADWDGWNEYTAYSGVPIVAPGRNRHVTFLENVEYVIDGVWGWKSVPPQVKEAARLLVNDYACADANYRDRFLTSMTAADWRIQFHEGAFSNTGNVRANQLLAPFVLRRGWSVI